MKIITAVILLPALLGYAQAQYTAQTSVAPHLRECYTDTNLVNRNNLPPTSIGVLIDIIRKIEDDPNVNVDMRQLSSLLLHTYRQDGIEYHAPEQGMSNNVLPFAATYFTFHRHRLLLTRLIPNNLQNLPNNTISSALKCGLHHMLSTTVDSRVRADEGVCNQLSQYRALRLPRSAYDGFEDDVEILDDSVIKSADKNGQIKEFNPNDEVEYESVDGVLSERQIIIGSQCPILGGVVDTTWGAVAAGNLIAGIAAGAEPQRVNINQLTRTEVDTSNQNQQFVNSIFPATLSGDLAEATLIQGTERGATNIQTGAPGGWNSTQARKFYMLQSRTNIEMTDAEIRGGIDGFVLGSTLQTTLGTFSSLKLSQLIDMYYSARNGVFNAELRACNRRALATQLINAETLNAETLAFATALDTNLPLRGTMMTGLNEVVNSAVTNFQTYASNNLNDVSCIATETSTPNYRLKTNLYLVVDSTWQYEIIYPAISYLLDSIEVGKYGSSVTLLSAFDGSVIINKTFSLADFHSNYTLIRHESMLTGVNLQTVFSNVRSLRLGEMDWERTNNYVGGNSTVLLFLLNSGTLINNNEVWVEASAINDTVPDLRILFGTSFNHIDVLWNLVRDMHNDIRTINLMDPSNVGTSMTPILDRVRLSGRRIINPNCGSNWNGDLSGSRHFDDFVEPDYVNFYAIAANYFYNNNDNRRVRISRTGGGAGSIIVCNSRTIEQPGTNSSTGGGDMLCQTLQGTGNIEIQMNNLCDGYYTINSCPPLYISVESNTFGSTTSGAVCSDSACRFPYNIRYQVQIEDFGCSNGTASIIANFFFIFLAFVITMRS